MPARKRKATRKPRKKATRKKAARKRSPRKPTPPPAEAVRWGGFSPWRALRKLLGR